MSAGYIQMAALGQQDAYLTGSPSVTYFKGVYSRNTPFVLEAYDIPFNGVQQSFGTESICKIPFKGDIVRGMTLKLNMPFLNNPGNDWNWSNVASESGFIPKITIDNKYFRAPTTGVTYYSSNLQSTSQATLGWITNPAVTQLFTSTTVGPVSGTSITLQFITGNVFPNYTMFPGYTATTAGVAGTMTVVSSTTTSIVFSMSSQTTGTIQTGNVVYMTGATLSSNVTYNANINKFAFTSYSNITVEPALATFWGFDPKNFDNIWPDGNLNYLVSSTSSHPGPISSADFTLEQGGWARGSGIPSSEKRAGLYMQIQRSIGGATKSSSSSFLMVTRAGDSSPNYMFFDATKVPYVSQVSGSTFCYVSTQGTIGFSRSGQYCIRGSIVTAGTDALYSISYGLRTIDGHPGTAQFLVEHVMSLTSTSPSPIFSIPVNITIPSGSSSIFMYIDIRLATDPQASLLPGSWLAIAPLDQFFTVGPTPVTTGTEIALGNMTSYPPMASSGALITPGVSSNSFLINQLGTFLITTSLALQTSTPTSIRVSSGTRGLNAYTYTTITGQNLQPSMDFVIPVTVDSTTLDYFLDMTMQSTTGSVAGDTILASNISSVQFIQNTNPNPGASFPQNGLMFTSTASSSGTIVSSPIQFSVGGSWNKVGGTSQINTGSGSQILIYVGGLYFLQTVLCTSDLLKSVTVTLSGPSSGTSTHVIGIGLQPPYNIGIPFFVTNATTLNPAIAAISFLTVSGTTTSVYSNTYFSLGILASNAISIYSYVDSIGTYVLDTVDLRIGGQVVQSLTGEEIEIYNDLYVPYENQPGLKVLTGKLDTSNVFDPGRSYYTNLPFYFYGNNELSIPICALDRSDLELAVTLRPFSNLSFVSNLSSVVQSMSMTVIVEYGFLSETEVKWMRNSTLNYLIVQEQATSYPLDAGFSTGIFKLPFLNPVRELFFVIQNTGTAPYDFSNNGLLNLGLQFNGQEYLSRQIVDSQYLQYVQTFQKYKITPSRQFYVYSFANDPMDPRPTGQVNFSRIRDVSLEVTVTPLVGTSRSLRVYATNYNILRIENGLAGLLFNFSQ